MYDTLILIKKLLETTFGSVIKSYFIDDLNLIPASALPCLAVSPVSTDISLADVARDLYTYTIDVILIINAMDEINKIGKEIVGTKFLTETMEKMNTDGSVNESTILYTLRKNLTLGSNWYIGNVKKIDYSLKVRSDQLITKEAAMQIQVLRIVNRPT